MAKTRQILKENAIRFLLMFIALCSILILGLITIFLFHEGLPIFSKISLKNFLLGKFWYPTYDPPEFGIRPMIVASIYVTALASLVAIPIGICSAIYLSEIANARMKEIFKPLIELSASIPSVVIGFFGMVVFAPFLQEWLDVATGLNLLNASLMLAFMAIPTISSISEDALHSVRRDLREASYALGATRSETIFRVVLPSALSGITTAVILGMSRAIGETMVVLMVAGGSAVIPKTIFSSCRPLPASIAAEMAEAPFRSDHYHALFATGVVLFIVTLFFNIIADYFSNKYKQTGTATL
jgi:phosphate transport system permease protein